MSFSFFASNEITVPFSVEVCSLDGLEARRRRDSMHPNFDEPFLRDARSGSQLSASNSLKNSPLPELYAQISLVSPSLSMLASTNFYEHGMFSLQRLMRPSLAFTTRTSYKFFSSECAWKECLTLPVLYRDIPRDAKLLISVWDVKGPSVAMPIAAGVIPLYTDRGFLKQGRRKVPLFEMGTGYGAAASLPVPVFLPDDLLCEENLEYLHQLKVARKAQKTAKRQRQQVGEQQKQQQDQQSNRIIMSGLQPSYDCDVPVSEDELERIDKVYKKVVSSGSGDWINQFSFLTIEGLKTERERHREGEMSIFISLPLFTHPVMFCEDNSGTVTNVGDIMKATSVKTTPEPAATAAAATAERSSLVEPGASAVSDGSNKSIPAVDSSPSSAGAAATSAAGAAAIAPVTPGPTDFSKWSLMDPELGMDNPVETKYLKLDRSSQRALGKIHREGLKPNSVEMRNINTILRYPPLKSLSYEDMQLLWKYASYLTHNSKALPKFLQCIDWNDAEEVKDAMEMVAKWDPVSPEDALLLLDKSYPSEQVREYAVSRLRTVSDEVLNVYLNQLVQAMRYEARATNKCLSLFLLDRACHNEVLGSFFFWYLTLEAEVSDFYRDMRDEFIRQRPKEHTEASQQQLSIVDKLSKIQTYLKTSGLNRQKQISKIKEMLSPDGDFKSLFQFSPVPLCIDPTIIVNGIDPEGSYVYKSAMMPIGISFKTLNWPGPDGSHRYKVIFKNGDDMRQDQMMVQMIGLMDSLLKKENLDLKLTPYKVLATSAREGMVQCINSQSIDHVLKEYAGDIQKFLRAAHPDSSGPYGISADVMDTYVKSVAGNSVITYILGVGDRHLDNLMLSPDGRMFHIDFGFILGNENKPFPPPMKICKEMVNGMGGPTSDHYQQFVQYCCETYTILRKSADLIIGLFKLMVDARIPDLSADPDSALMKLREKFRLELTDQEATQALVVLINTSVNALFPTFVDSVHRWAQYFKN